MNDDQKESLRRWKPIIQGEFALIERTDLSTGVSTSIKIRSDRDPEMKIAGLYGLTADQISLIRGLGIEAVTISFGTSDGKYFERYPVGESFAVKDFPQDDYGETAQSLRRSYAVMIRIKA
jgi:hypothetical protein